MAAEITLKIYMPEKLVLNTAVYRVVLPSDNKTLTVIKDRAPTLMTLDMGVLRVLDEHETTSAEWFIAGGVADIKEDTCTILTEAAFNKKELSLEKARALNEDFPNSFYQWLVEWFEREESTHKK